MILTGPGYWGLTQNKSVKYPFHAVHNAFDCGLVLLYAIESAPNILRQSYGVKRVLDVLNQMSALFLVASKTWPDAVLVGDRYDELQKAVTKRFVQGQDDDTANGSARLDCLRDMLFHVNRDALFSGSGHQNPLSPSEQRNGQWSHLLASPPESHQTFSLDPSLEIDMEWLANNMLDGGWDDSVLEWPGFPSEATGCPTTPVVATSPPLALQWPRLPPGVTGAPRPAVTSPPVPDRVAVDTAIELLPACRQCRERRVRCDRGFPSCNTCLSSKTECMHKDPISGEMTSRKHVADLHSTFIALMDEWESTGPSSMGPIKVINSIASAADSATLQFFGPSTAMVQIPATLTVGTSPLPVHHEVAEWFLSSGCSIDIPPPHVRNEILQEMKPLSLVYPVYRESDEFFLLFTQKQDLQATAENLLVIAICLQLRGKTDPRYKGLAMGYFNGALRAHSTIDFAAPSIRQTQLLTLECIFILLCPAAGDIWRMVGAAVRSWVELCERHDTTDDACWRLTRTLFCLEISICVALGRPPQSPCIYDSLQLDVPPTHPGEAFQIGLCNLSWLQALELIDFLGGVPSSGRVEAFSPGSYEDPMLDQFSQYFHARALRSTVAMAQALSAETVSRHFPFSWVDAQEVAAAVLRPPQPAQETCLHTLRWMAADPDLACQNLYEILASPA